MKTFRDIAEGDLLHAGDFRAVVGTRDPERATLYLHPGNYSAALVLLFLPDADGAWRHAEFWPPEKAPAGLEGRLGVQDDGTLVQAGEA